MQIQTHSSLCDCETCNQQVGCTPVLDIAGESSHLTQGMEPAGVQVASTEQAPQGTDEARAEDFIKPTTGKFRLRGKSFFLTYPRCQWEPKDFATFITTTHSWSKDFLQHITVREQHKDGTPHLHSIVEYKIQKETTNQKIFDIPVDPHHGDYGLVKNYPAAIRYLTKAGVPIATWDYATYLKKQVNQGHLKTDYTEVNQTAIKDGIKTLVDSGKIPLMNYTQWQRGLAAYNADLSRIEPVTSFVMKLPISYTPEQYLTRFIDLTDKTRRHYWFYGPTGTGKTYTAEHQDIPHYCVPKNNDWVGYNGAQLLIINEFKGEFTPTQIIDVIESRQQNIKGSSATLPSNLCVIITSNYSIRDCFHKLNMENDAQLDAIERRFTEVLFSEPHPTCEQGRDLIVLNALKGLAPPTDTQAKITRKRKAPAPLNTECIKKFKADNNIIDIDP